jgi:hypothetical protein
MTMSISEPVPDLRAAALRAYERGRFGGALARGAGAFVLAAPAWLACGRTPIAAACLFAFAATVAAARYIGREPERGARAGVIAGILPCLLPAVLRLFDPDLCEILFARGPWLCAATGIAAGAILGFRSRAVSGTSFWAAAILTLVLAATLGCIPAGVMGFSGLAIGVVAGGVPALAARRISS